MRPGIQFKHKSVTTVLTYLLIVLPPLICLWYVNTFGVDVPYWDEWGFVGMLKEIYGGTASWFSILWKQSNEHLSGIPFLLMAGLAKLTHYNTRAEKFENWVFLALTWVLLLRIARERLPNRGRSWLVVLLPISWLVCSLRQYESLLQIQTLSIFFFVLAIYLLDCRDNYWFLGLAVLSGLCSTLSFGNGVLIWPLGVLQILLKVLWKKNPNKSYKPLMIWSIVSLIVGLCCLFCYERTYLLGNPYGLTPAMWSKQSWDIFCFFVAYLTSPLIATINDNTANSYPYIVVTQGLVLLVIYTVVVALALRQRKDVGDRVLVPLMLILYVVASDCLTLFARVGGGINQALASRYTSISCLGIVGAYLILLIINKTSVKVRASLLGALLVPVLTSTIMCTKVGVEEGSRIRVQRILLSYVVLSYKQQDPRVFPLLKLPPNFKDLASFLETNHLSVFRKPHPNLHIPVVKLDSDPVNSGAMFSK